VFSRKLFPRAEEELANIQKRIENSKRVFSEVEALTLTKGYPGDIARKVDRLTGSVIDHEWTAFPSERIRPPRQIVRSDQS
jgi:hypothetical protein